MNRPLLLGHRGAKKYALENTFEAFDLALEHGCDGFEFDVHSTADARCVVCHDPVHRNRVIAESTFDDLQLPCAVEVIRRYGGRAFLDIELKTAKGVTAVCTAVEKLAHPTFVLSSFLPAAIELVRDALPDPPVGLICEDLDQFVRWHEVRPSMVIVHRTLISQELLREVRSAGARIFVWTVNSAQEMARFAKMGVDGLISDDTRLLVHALKQR